MKALRIPALLAVAATMAGCDQPSEPTVSLRPSSEVIYNGENVVSIELAAKKLYDYNNCLTGVYPYYKSTVCGTELFTDVEPNYGSDINIDLVWLYDSATPDDPDASDDLDLDLAGAIAHMQTYIANVNLGYDKKLISCRGRYALVKAANDLITALQNPPTFGLPSYYNEPLVYAVPSLFTGATQPNGAPCPPPPPAQSPPPAGAPHFSIFAIGGKCSNSLHWKGNKGSAASAVHSNAQAQIKGVHNFFWDAFSFGCGANPLVRDGNGGSCKVTKSQRAKHTGWNGKSPVVRHNDKDDDSDSDSDSDSDRKKKHCGNSNYYEYIPQRVAEQPSPIQGISWGAYAPLCTRSVNGHMKLSGNGPWWVGGNSSSGQLVDGVYCATGDIELGNSNVTGNVTFVAGGKITLSGSGLSFHPYVKNTLAYSVGHTITISGSTSGLWGNLFAPDDKVTISGNSVKLTGAIVADRVEIFGNEIAVNGAVVYY